MTTAAPEPELLATSWSHAGRRYPLDEDQRSPFLIEDRIEAVAAARFTGIGSGHAYLFEARDRLGGYGKLRALLERHGLTVEVEWLDGWYLTGPAREASDARQAELLHAAQQLGADHVKAGCALDGPIAGWDTLVAEFAALCEQAARHKTRIAFEPMPLGPNAMTLGGARQLVEQAGHKAGGLQLDPWHMWHGCGTHDDVAALPAGIVTAVELGDADRRVVGTLVEDMLNRRRLCGEGDMDVAGFIQAVKATGYAGLWGIEVIADDFRKLPLLSQVGKSYSTTRAALDAALGQPPETIAPAGSRSRTSTQEQTSS